LDKGTKFCLKQLILKIDF